MLRLKKKLFIFFSVLFCATIACDQKKTEISTNFVNEQTTNAATSLFDTLVTGTPLKAELKCILPKKPAEKINVGEPIIVKTNKNKFPIKSPNVRLVAADLPTAQPGEGEYKLPVKTTPTGKKQNINFPLITEALPPNSADAAYYNLQYLDVDQGLSPGFILDVTEDSRGNLWVSTWASGVSMYNGNSFSNYTIDAGLVSNYIWTILEDNQGNIWFGSDDDGVCKYDGDQFTTYTVNDGLAGNTVSKIIEDERNNLWFATNGGLTKYDGKQFINYGKAQGLGGDIATNIANGSNNSILITTENGMSIFDGVLFTHFTTNEGLTSNNTTAIYEDSKENIWIGTRDAGVIIYDGYTFFSFNESHGLPENAISAIAEDGDGNIWLSTENSGVCKYNRSHFLHITRKEGLSSNTVRTIYKDSNNNLWFGTDGGLNKYNEHSFRNFTREDELGDLVIRSICEDKFGNIWLGHAKGISKFDGETFKQYTTDQGLSDNFVRALIQDHKGNLWIATNAGGAVYFDGETFTQYTVQNGLSNNFILSIYEDDDHAIWMGTNGKGLTKFDGENFYHFTTEQGLSSNVIRAITQDADGNMWFGTVAGGLEKWDGENITHYSQKEGLGQNTILSLMPDTEGNLWIGRESGGISILKNGMINTITEENGLSNNIIWSIVEDYDQNVWVGTENGLDLIEINEKEHLRITNYGKLDGLKGTDFYPNAVCLDSDNKIWWGTGKGLSMLDLNKYQKRTAAPKLSLTNMEVDQHYVDFRALKVANKNPGAVYNHPYFSSADLKKVNFKHVKKFANVPSEIEIPYNLNHLTFHFSANDWTAQHKLKYRYKLEGKDNLWRTKTDNQVVYSYLPAGNYTFRLKAAGEGNSWTDAISIPIRINPPWWRTIWAFIIYFILAISLIVAFVTWRTNKLIRRQRLLQSLVNERTQEVVKQKELVESKNQEIIDSINYAKRIQKAILPSSGKVKRQLANVFIYFSPKAIVAGDFYWLEEKENKILLAAADCTGHGVPGAMISLVCNNTLNRTVREFDLIEPALILNKVRDLVISAFTNSLAEVQDGMDISLISLDIDTNLLKYAEANNNLYIISAKGELTVLKADRQPIGKYIKTNDFTQHEIQLNRGDTFYLFTDGFIDQFGGPNEKKFKTRRFVDLLLSIQHLQMNEQKKHLRAVFTSWKGNLEQIDDVCILGVRV